MSDLKDEIEVGTCDDGDTCQDLPIVPEVQEKSETLTYGEKAVGLNFNPGGSGDVTFMKQYFANIIDILNNTRNSFRFEAENELMTYEQRAVNGEVQRLLSVAITEAQTAQMWAVKAITFNLK